MFLPYLVNLKTNAILYLIFRKKENIVKKLDIRNKKTLRGDIYIYFRNSEILSDK
jgi:hypothetical protein